MSARAAVIGGQVTVDVLREAGIFGNGHTMMLEKNNRQVMYRMIAWLEGNVFKPKKGCDPQQELGWAARSGRERFSPQYWRKRICQL